LRSLILAQDDNGEKSRDGRETLGFLHDDNTESCDAGLRDVQQGKTALPS
jgi:hypothetical protein